MHLRDGFLIIHAGDNFGCASFLPHFFFSAPSCWIFQRGPKWESKSRPPKFGTKNRHVTSKRAREHIHYGLHRRGLSWRRKWELLQVLGGGRELSAAVKGRRDAEFCEDSGATHFVSRIWNVQFCHLLKFWLLFPLSFFILASDKSTLALRARIWIKTLWIGEDVVESSKSIKIQYPLLIIFL